MLSITRYILRQLVVITAFITVALTAAVWLSQSLRFMDYIVNRGLPATDFVAFMVLLLPQFLGVVVPIAAFCAVLFVYHRLLVESELVVLRSAGFSQLQLARPALTLAVAVTVAGYAISLYFLPASYRAFKDLQFRIRNDYSAVLLQEGAFNTLSDGITVYVRERTSDGELLGILVHDSRDRKQAATMMAERGALVRTDEGPRVVLVNGNRQTLEGDQGHLAVLYFDRYTVDLGELQEPIEDRWRQPKERYLGELLQPSAHDPRDQRYASELVAEGHRRLVFPFYTLVFVAVALAALLSGEFNRRGQLHRVLAAAVCVAVLEAASLGLSDLASRTSQAVPALYALPMLALAAAVVVLLRRPRRASAAASLPAQALEPGS